MTEDRFRRKLPIALLSACVAMLVTQSVASGAPQSSQAPAGAPASNGAPPPSAPQFDPTKWDLSPNLGDCEPKYALCLAGSDDEDKLTAEDRINLRAIETLKSEIRTLFYLAIQEKDKERSIKLFNRCMDLKAKLAKLMSKLQSRTTDKSRVARCLKEYEACAQQAMLEEQNLLPTR